MDSAICKERNKVYSQMDVLRLMKDALYAEQSDHPHRALSLVNQAFLLLAELHPQISGEREGGTITALLLQSHVKGPTSTR